MVTKPTFSATFCSNVHFFCIFYIQRDAFYAVEHKNAHTTLTVVIVKFERRMRRMENFFTWRKISIQGFFYMQYVTQCRKIYCIHVYEYTKIYISLVLKKRRRNFHTHSNLHVWHSIIWKHINPFYTLYILGVFVINLFSHFFVRFINNIDQHCERRKRKMCFCAIDFWATTFFLKHIFMNGIVEFQFFFCIGFIDYWRYVAYQ